MLSIFTYYNETLLNLNHMYQMVFKKLKKAYYFMNRIINLLFTAHTSRDNLIA